MEDDGDAETFYERALTSLSTRTTRTRKIKIKTKTSKPKRYRLKEHGDVDETPRTTRLKRGIFSLFMGRKRSREEFEDDLEQDETHGEEREDEDEGSLTLMGTDRETVVVEKVVRPLHFNFLFVGGEGAGLTALL